MRLLTRREIIKIWSKQPKHMLDSKCCPICRDILEENSDGYCCLNDECPQDNISKGEIDQ